MPMLTNITVSVETGVSICAGVAATRLPNVLTSVRIDVPLSEAKVNEIDAILPIPSALGKVAWLYVAVNVSVAM